MTHLLDDPNFVLGLSELLAENKTEEFFDRVYNALCEDVDASVRHILANKKEIPFRLKQIHRMIKMYEDDDEYEKCGMLNSIVSKVTIELDDAKLHKLLDIANNALSK